MRSHARSQTSFTLFAVVLAALGASLAGCGSDTSPADGFVGTWHYDEAQSTVTCGQDTLPQPPTPNKTFGAGIATALVDLSPSALDPTVNCDFGFDVAGPVATVKAGQVCALTGGDTVTVDHTNDNAASPLWTFTLNSPTSAEELATATIHFKFAGATADAPPTETTCAYSLIAHLTRLSKD
jgi:hypothetical protein